MKIFVKTFVTLCAFLCISDVQSQSRYITTIHPFETILMSIVGDHGHVSKLLPPGASPHTYELRPSDMRHVASATAFVVGGENLDDWALNLSNPHIIELLHLIPSDSLIRIETHGRKPHGDHHHHHAGIDPHFWTDPLLVKSMIPGIVDTLCALDPDGRAVYRENAGVFMSGLDSLHVQITEILEPHVGSAVMLSHPFFQYFLKRYGFRLAGIVETSPGTEPSPKELRKNISMIVNEDVRAIFTHPQLSNRPALLIAESTDVKICELDPIGGVGGRMTYEELMIHNARKIAEILR
ncbi:MAG: metal ABC transporter substrate-binding protein [candidate division KSB1 bacterium]|jgi:zinc transport system substrate-binding protein|nr:metal ABC transporter substrate-binding protein [candidate division KSB1 bacterium]